MSDFEGQVLRGPRVAPSNDPKTGAPRGGVDADNKNLTATSFDGGSAPSHAPDHGFTSGFLSAWGDNSTHPCVDQYRAAVLMGSADDKEEYLVFSANTASICSVETGDAEVTKGTVKIPRKGDYLCITGLLGIISDAIESGANVLDNELVQPYLKKLEGTLSFVDGNAVVSGIGTDFEAQITEGLELMFQDGGSFYSLEVSSVDSVDQLTLTEPFEIQLEEGEEDFTTVQSDLVMYFNPYTASNRLVLNDDGGRSLSGVKYLKVRRGDVEQDEEHIITLTVSAGDIEMSDPASGIIQILDTDSNRERFSPWGDHPPGLSRDRGDVIIEVGYYLSSPKFFWTRNDSLQTRFGWDGKAQRWVPYKGSAIKNLGVLEDTTTQLIPRPKNLTVGNYLPGTQVPDSVAMVRLGGSPNAGSYALGDDTSDEPYNKFRGILVVPDSILDDDKYDFSRLDPSPIGVIGSGNGIIRWNPAVFALYAGQLIWYIPNEFDSKSKGEVGKVKGSDIDPLFICPIPSPTDRPLLRIGNRRWLDVIFADNDADLVSLEPETKQVAISLTTGQVKLSEADITKADMGDVEAPNPDFEPLWAGATLFYDGVSMSQIPQPLKAPAKLADSFSTRWGHSVPLAIPVPGLGVSGVRLIEDGTGREPDLSQGISRRPQKSGVKRTARGVGETFVFTPNAAWENLYQMKTSRFEDGSPGSQSVYIDYGINLNNSDLKFHRRAARRPHFGQPLYYQTTDFTPAFHSSDGKMWSRKDGPYQLHGDEILRLVCGGANPYIEWRAEQLTEGYTKEARPYSAEQIASSLNEVFEGEDSEYRAGFVQNRLYLYGLEDTMCIEVLPGIAGEKDLSGCAALGFNPYWKIQLPVSADVVGTSMDVNWLPDTGSCLGFKRSPYNKGSRNATPDFRDQNRVEEMFMSTVQPSPFVYLREPPLEDIAGLDEGVFFELQDGPYRIPLKHMDNILCKFGKGYFKWLDSKNLAFTSTTPVSTVSFGYHGVVPESLHPALKGYFFEREPGGEEGFLLQEEGEDFIFVQEGETGTVILTNQIGEQTYRGSKGEFTEGENTFTDTSVDSFSSVASIGYRLKVLAGDSAGSYIITDFPSDTEISVYPKFPSDSDGVVSYEIYELEPIDNMDNQVVADWVYKRFNHLPQETFEVHLLSPIGFGTVEHWFEETQTVSVSRDYARNRSVHIRIGLKSKNETTPISVRWLKKFEMGELMNESLFIDGNLFDDPTHFPTVNMGDTSTWKFRLRIATLLVHPNEMTVVSTAGDFSEDPAVIEVAEDTGELKFGSEILDTYGQAVVVFEETLRDATDLAENTAEVDPDSGELQISSVNLELPENKRETVYWVSRMVTEDQTDVFVNPMVGAFMFREPLDEWHIVEASYWSTDPAGDRLLDEEGDILPEKVEFLPLLLRAEECVEIDEYTYSFNPTGRTVRQDIEPVIYVGPEMANQNGGTVVASVDYVTNTITLSFPTLPPSDEPLQATDIGDNFMQPPNPLSMFDVRGRKVTITYGVLESFGGEVSYTVSAPPVWRPPFHLEGGVNTFELMSDRTQDVFPGQLMRLGAFQCYMKSVDYDVESDTTTVTFFPTSPSAGAGSRAPGNDVLTLITEFPVTRVVDPFDPVVIDETPSGNLVRSSLSTPHGFLVPLEERIAFGKDDPTPIPVVFEPTPKNRSEIIFFKNLIKFIDLGFLMEIGGCPHTIVGLQLSEDGTRTEVKITPPLTQNIVYGEQDVYVSFRPLYPAGPVTYQGLDTPFLSKEVADLVLWGETDAFGNDLPGRTLAPTQEYQSDPQNGDITFQYPYQEYLRPEQWLTFRRVQVRVLKPRISNGYPELPTFKIRFKHTISPSSENGLLDTALLGTFSYKAPDSFYYRQLPLLDFSGETAIRILKEAASKSSSYGSQIGGFSNDNWEQGRVGIDVEKSFLYDRDRAARAFLGYFNSVVVGFEQITECATGGVVGDRDGKFRFHVGKGLEYTPRGFENPVTGMLNPRYAYGRAFQSLLPDGMEVIVEEDDLIVSPFDFEIDEDYDLEGEFPESDIRRVLWDSQRLYVKNDVDDRVMVNYRTRWVLGFPFLRLKIEGRVKAMDEKHQFSRLFSTQADYFTTTYPGAASNAPVGDFGIYTFFQKRKDKWRSTWMDTIGFIENPVLGNIESLSDVNMRERYPRARVYEYSEVGFPEMDDKLFDLGEADPDSFTLKPRPAVIASVLPLEEFPLKDGMPDFDQFATNQNSPDGDSTPDLNSGAFEEHTPPWGVGMRLQFGHPDGSFVIPKYNDLVGMLGFETYLDIYVGEIIRGCVMTFAYKDGGDLKTVTNSNMIIDEANDNRPIKLKRSDTLLKMAGDGVVKIEEDELDFTKLNEYSAMLPSYRVGWDVGVVNKSGRIRDVSLPSWRNPFFGLQELLGQNPIKPHTRIEGEVEFHNSSVTPTFIPALLGDSRNDSGDYTLPYLKSSNTELLRLREAQAEVLNILQQDGPAGVADHDWLSVYPDEFLNLTQPAGASGLYIPTDVKPVETAGSYDQGTGIGDLREGDLMIVETSPSDIPVGVQGILSVGSIEVLGDETVVGLPRFVTQTHGEDSATATPGAKIHYNVRNLTAVIGDFTGDTDGVWREDDATPHNPYGSQGIKVIETQVNGPDPAEFWTGGYTETEIIFNSLMFDVDDGSASIPDGIDFGSGFNDPPNVYSTGGLNSILAGAGVGTELRIDLLKRADIQQDPDGINYLEPIEGTDGRVKLRLTLKKTSVGDSYQYITQDAGFAAHIFEIVAAMYPEDSVPGASETIKIPKNKVWFYTSTEANKPSRMVIKTLHPEDPQQYPDPFPAGHPNEGDPNPDSDPDAIASWFPWDEYTHLHLDDPDDDDENDVISIRRTHGFDEETESVFADTYEEFLVSLDVIDGVHSHIKTDRITFHSKFDSRQAYPRLVDDGESLVEPVHPYGVVQNDGDAPISLSLSFEVPKVTILVHAEDAADPLDWDYSEVLSTVNSADSVNGGDPFTFLPRHTYQDDLLLGTVTKQGVGYWYGGYGDLKVMGFEGHNNQTISFPEPLMLTAIPSSDLHPTGLITGTVLGNMSSWFETDDPASDPADVGVFHHRITPVVEDYGAMEDNSVAGVTFDPSKVEKGDVVYVSAGGAAGTDPDTGNPYPLDHGSVKVGTYLVKYALASDGSNLTPPDVLDVPDGTQEPPIRPVRSMDFNTLSGVNSDLDLSFPTITGIKWVRDPEEFRVYVNRFSFNSDFPTTSKTGFPDSGTMYVLLENPTEDMDGDTFNASVVRIEYTEINVDDSANPYFVIDIDEFRNASTASTAPASFTKYTALNKLFGVILNNAVEIQAWWITLDEAAGEVVAEYDDNSVSNPDTWISKNVAGMKYYSINLFHPNTSKFPHQRLVGYDWNTVTGPENAATDQASHGVVMVDLRDANFAAYGGDPILPGFVPTVYWTANGKGFGTVSPVSLAPPTDDWLYVGSATPVTAGEFHADEHAIVYNNTPTYLDFSKYDLSVLNLNTDLGAGALDFLLPTTRMHIEFWADSGIFLERNFPKPTFDLGRSNRSIICNETDPPDINFPAYGLPPEDVGERDTMDYDDGDLGFEFSEHVMFSVRRVRRWHDVLLPLSEAMAGLRFAYEIRRGEVDTYTFGTTFHKINLTSPGTQLGPLDNEDVNVNPGDIVRVIDPTTKKLKCFGEISNVLSGTELRIWPPGFIGEGVPETGDLVEIYLNKAPVPQEQSNEQLLELATEELIFERKAEMTVGENGYPASGGIVKWDDSEVSADEFGHKPPDEVYMASVNLLTDTNAGIDTGMINFETEGVKEGDYILIDPAGELTGPTGQVEPIEVGDRPYGDRGADITQDEFYPGRPSEFDDNRGYYKVIKVEQTRLEVSPNRDGDSEIIGGTGTSGVLNATHGGLSGDTYEFALYPTIRGSLLTGVMDEASGFAGEEGQGDLRPTAFAGEDPLHPDDPETPPNSFGSNPFSVGPFSYRIIRPTKLISDDAVELILFHRERILSLMENFESSMQEDKKGNYWDFQNDRHSFDLGIPTIPDTGLGVPRNAYLYGLAGWFMVSPFMGDSDCLSILDRRVTLEDILLDREKPPFSDAADPYYTKFGEEDGLPLLLGRIEQLLDKSDRIRRKRLAWLYLRTTKTDGTLANIRNWDHILRERKREQARLRRLQESNGG